jgi:hypothetical protein
MFFFLVSNADVVEGADSGLGGILVTSFSLLGVGSVSIGISTVDTFSFPRARLFALRNASICGFAGIDSF